MNDASLLRDKLHTKRFKFSSVKYPFKNILTGLFGTELEDLHKYLGFASNIEKDSKSLQSTLAHKVFYSNFDEKLGTIYRKFLNEVVMKIVNSPFYYQRIPTFRIAPPGSIFVSKFHRDSDFNHQSYELNFNLGLANYKGGNFMIEDKPSSENYLHLDCPYGEIVSIDHISCTHGSLLNESEQTMVSFDFRLALMDNYYESKLSSLTNKTQFSLGKYFSSEPIYL